MEGIRGAGLGLRGGFLHELSQLPNPPGWLEVVPENWMHMPPATAKAFETIAADYPLVCHGLSLSIGANTPLDTAFLHELKTFMDRYDIAHYSEHLSFCSIDDKQLYELLPLPMTENMVQHIVSRVQQVQDILKRPLILENASYYYVPYREMEESDFINEVLRQSGAGMLLDVNNVYVNSINHHFDAKAFIRALDTDRVEYLHVAGHLEYEPDLLIDTHGTPVNDDVWELLEWTLKEVTAAPVLLERDNNIPPLREIIKEYDRLRKVCDRYGA